jgi:putative Mg2+ transporter-C (MgtC) family protein
MHSSKIEFFDLLQSNHWSNGSEKVTFHESHTMNINLDTEIALRLLISFAVGAAIGLEREYRSKAAGFRTMIMICLGSTIFTELSIHIGGENPDRIAASIVSGIGFLGAGVIFKDGLTVTGITTATTIWIASALGMAVGAGEYFIAIVGSGVVLIVLTLLEKIQSYVERWHQTRSYRINVNGPEDFCDELERLLASLQLSFKKRRDMKEGESFVLIYEIYGRESRIDSFNSFLKREPRVISFEY